MAVITLQNSPTFHNRRVSESLLCLNPKWQQNVNNVLPELLQVTVNLVGFENKNQN